MLFAGKWMELEIIMLSEESQAQKDEGGPHIWKQKDKSIHKYIFDLIYIAKHTYTERERERKKEREENRMIERK
jgi:hypothetical protein